MFWVLLEIVIALLIAAFIVWWTMPRPHKPRDDGVKDEDA